MERRYDLHHYEIIMLPTRQYFDRQVIMHMNWILGIVGKCWSFSECPTFLFRKYWRDWLQELNGSGMKWLGSNRHYNDFTHYAGTRNRKLSFVKKHKDILMVTSNYNYDMTYLSHHEFTFLPRHLQSILPQFWLAWWQPRRWKSWCCSRRWRWT